MKKLKVLFLQESLDRAFATREPITTEDYKAIIHKIALYQNNQNMMNVCPSDYSIELFRPLLCLRLSRHTFDILILLCDYTKTVKKIGLILYSYLLRSKSRYYFYSKVEYETISANYVLFLFMVRPLRALKYTSVKLMFIGIIVGLTLTKFLKSRK